MAKEASVESPGPVAFPWPFPGGGKKPDQGDDEAIELPPVLLIPGIGGSILNAVNQNGAADRIWVRLFRADYEFRSKLWSKYNHETGRTESLDPDIHIEVPEDNHGLYSCDVLDPSLNIPLDAVCYYHSMIQAMRGWGYKDGQSLFGFGYDFRQSNRLPDTLDRLTSRLAAIHAKTGRKVCVVTHSMGGLLFKSYLALHRDHYEAHVDKWVAIAAPFRGAPGFIVDTLLTGVEFLKGWKKSLFVAKWTMHQLMVECPSIYELLADYEFEWEEKPEVRVVIEKMEGEEWEEEGVGAVDESKSSRTAPKDQEQERRQGKVEQEREGGVNESTGCAGTVQVSASEAAPVTMAAAAAVGASGTGSHSCPSGTAAPPTSGSPAAPAPAYSISSLSAPSSFGVAAALKPTHAGPSLLTTVEKRLADHPSLINLMHDVLRDNKICINGTCVPLPFNHHIVEWAQHTKRIWRSMSSLPPSSSFFSIYGTSLDTPFHSTYGSHENPLRSLQEILHTEVEFECVDGDGTVPVESARADGLPALFRVGVPGEHRALLNDPRVHRLLRHFLGAGPPDLQYDPYTDCVIVPPTQEVENRMEKSMMMRKAMEEEEEEEVVGREGGAGGGGGCAGAGGSEARAGGGVIVHMSETLGGKVTGSCSFEDEDTVEVTLSTMPYEIADTR